MKFEELEEAGVYKWTYEYPDSKIVKICVLLISGTKPFLTVDLVWSVNNNRLESKDLLRGKPDYELEKINL
jgi:hypothetical protein